VLVKKASTLVPLTWTRLRDVEAVLAGAGRAASGGVTALGPPGGVASSLRPSVPSSSALAVAGNAVLHWQGITRGQMHQAASGGLKRL
jgi:hypothetical protein